MEVKLTPSWILTDEHSASSYGIPVLVNRGTQEAYGCDDIVKPYRSWGYCVAKHAVERMAKTADLTEEEWDFVKRFYVKGE